MPANDVDRRLLRWSGDDDDETWTRLGYVLLCIITITMRLVADTGRYMLVVRCCIEFMHPRPRLAGANCWNYVRKRNEQYLRKTEPVAQWSVGDFFLLNHNRN